MSSFQEPQLPVSYIIYKETVGAVDYYFAQNGRTGAIDYGGQSNAGGVDGTNASAVIQAAIDALAKKGGKIYLKEGKYILPTYIVINQPFFQLIGAGMYATILEAKNSDAIHLKLPDGWDSLHNILLQDFAIESDESSGHGIFSDIMAGWNHITYATFRRIRIRDVLTPLKYAFHLKNGEKVKIEDCFFHRTNNVLLQVHQEGYGGIQLSLINNRFDVGSSNTIAINIDSGDQHMRSIASFHNNFLAGETLINTTGIKIRATGGEITDVTFFRDKFEHFETSIDIDGSASYQAKRIHLLDCYFGQWNIDGAKFVKLGSNTRLVKVTGCHFWGTLTYSFTGIEDLNANTEANQIHYNTFDRISNPITPSATTQIRYNIGFVTENSGTETMTSGTYQTWVTHGCALTPTIVELQGHHSEVADLIVNPSNINASQFLAEVSAPVTGDRTFFWKAEV